MRFCQALMFELIATILARIPTYRRAIGVGGREFGFIDRNDAQALQQQRLRLPVKDTFGGSLTVRKPLVA